MITGVAGVAGYNAFRYFSAKYPGQVLAWDRAKLAFTNHAEATRTIVKRDYRKGFEPVRLGA